MNASRTFDRREVGRHLLFAFVVGSLGAICVVVFCFTTDFIFSLNETYEWLIYLLPLFSLITLPLYRFCKLPFEGSTIRSLVTMVRSDHAVAPTYGPAMFFSTVLSILGGASVDRTAGTLYIGASIGEAVGRPFRLKTIRTKKAELVDENHEGLFNEYLDELTPLVDVDTPPSSSDGSSVTSLNQTDREDVRKRGMHGYAAACGMAAAMSALYFAPLGATVFVLESSQFERSVRRHIASIFLAALVAAGINQVIHVGNILPRVTLPELSWRVIGQMLVIGVVCALVGIVLVTFVTGLQHWTVRKSRNYVLWVLIGSGLTILFLNLFGWDIFKGDGVALIDHAIKGTEEPYWFLMKALLTVVALGFWIKGGEIMPTLVIGALVGSACTYLTGGDTACAAIVGMVTLFAAVTRCPLAAILLGCEIFGWEGFPLFLIAILVTSFMGRDIGLYGEGAKTAFRRLVRDTRQHTRHSEAEKKEP